MIEVSESNVSKIVKEGFWVEESAVHFLKIPNRCSEYVLEGGREVATGKPDREHLWWSYLDMAMVWTWVTAMEFGGNKDKLKINNDG